MKWMFVVIFCCVSVGCIRTGVRPRTAELSRHKAVRLDYTLAPSTRADSTISYRKNGSPDMQQKMGDSGWRERPSLPAFLSGFLFFNGAISFGYGLKEWLELQVELGVQEQGLGVRMALLNERLWSSPFSLAASARASYRPFEDVTQIGGQLGFDLSKSFDRGHVFTPFINVYATYGPESYTLGFDEKCGGPGQSNCKVALGRPDQFFHIIRSELRLDMGFGAKIRVHKDRGFYLLATFMPYIILWNREPKKQVCIGCSGIQIDSFQQNWGYHVAFTWGYDW